MAVLANDEFRIRVACSSLQIKDLYKKQEVLLKARFTEICFGPYFVVMTDIETRIYYKTILKDKSKTIKTVRDHERSKATNKSILY